MKNNETQQVMQTQVSQSSIVDDLKREKASKRIKLCSVTKLDYWMHCTYRIYLALYAFWRGKPCSHLYGLRYDLWTNIFVRSGCLRGSIFLNAE